jgi:hypothetical protein
MVRQEGSDVRLVVNANASPQPTYQWFKDGSPITGATRETLELRNIRIADGGNYSVTVTNGLGTASKLIATLTVTASVVVPGAQDVAFYAGRRTLEIADIATQSDNKVLIAGSFKEVDHILSPGVARLHSNGAFDLSFRASAEGMVTQVLPLSGGKTLIGGLFAGPNGNNALVAQLNADGSYDAGFQALEGSGLVYSMLRLPADRTLIGGMMSIAGPSPRDGIALLEPNGSVNAAFVVALGGQKTICDGLHPVRCRGEGRIRFDCANRPRLPSCQASNKGMDPNWSNANATFQIVPAGRVCSISLPGNGL